MSENPTKPLLLDLFCGIGGASMGYSRAGFDVVGVDWNPMPKYPFPFIRANVFEFVEENGLHEVQGRKVAAIHASPPCKKWSTLNAGLGWRDNYTDTMTPTRAFLEVFDAATRDKDGRVGVPYVIENVPGAPMREALVLCGSMFGLRCKKGYLQRHRLFESNIFLMAPGPCNHGLGEGLKAIGVYGRGTGGGVLRNRTANAAEAREMLGISWAGREGISQAIPPVYAEHVGLQMLAHVNRVPAISFPVEIESDDSYNLEAAVTSILDDRSEG